MAHTELFILLHESDILHSFMYRSKECVTEKEEIAYLNHLREFINDFKHENYHGFYDSNNIKSHLSQFEILNDYYPCNPTIILRELLEEWEDWREDVISNGSYEVFKNYPIKDHTFCEIAERKFSNSENSYLIINHEATYVKDNVNISVKDTFVTLDILPFNKVFNWFCENRVPKRIYHHNPKHGEYGKGNWPNWSVLLGSKEEAAELLKSAINTNIKTLYNYDIKYLSYIIFRKEGNIPELAYHAYHIAEKDVTKEVKLLINKYIKTGEGRG